MASDLPSILDRMIKKFERRAPLTDGDRDALRRLPYRLQKLEAGKYIVREGSSATHSALIPARTTRSRTGARRTASNSPDSSLRNRVSTFPRRG